MDARTLTLNLVPGGVLPRINCSQYDEGIPVSATIYDGDSPYTIPTTAQVFVQGRKKDGTLYQYQCGHSGSVATFTLTKQMTMVAGENIAEISIHASGVIVGTINFVVNVEEAAFQTDEQSQSDIPIIDELPELVARAEAAAVIAAGGAENSEAWAVGERNGEPVESSDVTYHNNSKYWSDIAEQYASMYGNSLKWSGSIFFADIPSSGMANGDWYNIKDAFTTDSRFMEGAGIECPAGADIAWTVVSDAGKWNVLTPSGVISFNGRTGTVTPQSGDYTPAMVGVTTMTGATSGAAGAAGYVPAPAAGDDTKYLKGDGTWGTPAGSSVSDMTGATSSADGTHGLVPAPLIADKDKYLKGDGTWETPTDTTYSDMVGAGASTAGTHGLVPAPAAGDQDKCLKGDGTWGTVGGGHTIVNSSGTAMTQRSKLKFANATVTDDSTNDVTIVNPTQYIDQNQKTTASGVDTFSFSSELITTNSAVEVFCNVDGADYNELTVSNGTATVKYNSSLNVTLVRLYIRG